MSARVGIYESEDAARNAADKLTEAGFGENRVFLASQLAGREEAALRSAVGEDYMPGSQIKACVRQLKQGRSLVSVRPAFGKAYEATEIMASCGAIERDTLPPTAMRNPSPLSDALELPTLTEFTPMTNLASSHWSLSKVFGIPLLSNNPAPLSSMFGMKLLKAETHKTSSFGMPLLSSNPAPLSSLFGMKLLTRDKHKDSSFGFPLLSDNPAPLSSLFSLRLLTSEAKKKD